MRVKPLFAWYDLWVGAFWDRAKRKLYLLPLPCIGLVFELGNCTHCDGLGFVFRRGFTRHWIRQRLRQMRRTENVPPNDRHPGATGTKMTGETPYLICHKVRGQPAFDVAIKLEGDIWIIPTSGHRAYPFWLAKLSIAIKNYLGEGHPKDMEWLMTQLPPTLPDHYSANDTKPKRMSELTLEDLEL